MYVPYVFKELLWRKSRTVTTLSIVAVVTVILMLSTSLINSYSSAVFAPFRMGSELILQRGGNSTSGLESKIRMPFGKTAFTEDELGRFSSLGHVTGVSKSLVLWNFQRDGFQSIEGVEPDSFIGERLSSYVVDGVFLGLNGSEEAVLESHFARFNHIDIGDSISLGNESFTVVGILKNREGAQVFSSNIFLRYSDAKSLGDFGGFNQVYLKVDDISNEEAVKSQVSWVDSQVTASSANPVSASIQNVVVLYGRFYLLGMGFVILVTALLLMKVSATGLMEREKDIAVMRSVGWSKHDVLVEVVAEFVIQALAGFFLGALATYVILLLVPAVGVDASGQNIAVPLHFPVVEALAYLMLVSTISLSVSTLLARKTASANPADNLRKQ